MILALDTTLDACSVALATDGGDGGGGEVIAQISESRARGHAEALIPMVESLIAGAGRRMGDISKIIVTTGPGTFTGVRIGIAAARGLALALEVPVIGVPTLDAMAASAAAIDFVPAGTSVLAAIDARRGDLYLALYRALKGDFPIAPVLAPARVATGSAEKWLGEWSAKPIIAIGSGARMLADLMPDIQTGELPEVPDMGLLACLGSGLPDKYCAGPPAPLYLRPPDAVPAQRMLTATK